MYVKIDSTIGQREIPVEVAGRLVCGDTEVGEPRRAFVVDDITYHKTGRPVGQVVWRHLHQSGELDRMKDLLSD